MFLQPLAEARSLAVRYDKNWPMSMRVIYDGRTATPNKHRPPRKSVWVGGGGSNAPPGPRNFLTLPFQKRAQPGKSYIKQIAKSRGFNLTGQSPSKGKYIASYSVKYSWGYFRPSILAIFRVPSEFAYFGRTAEPIDLISSAAYKVKALLYFLTYSRSCASTSQIGEN